MSAPPNRPNTTQAGSRGVPSSEPPPYSPPIRQPPSFNAPSTIPASNVGLSSARLHHVYINEQVESISGSWTIDPNVIVPPSTLPPAPHETDSLHVESQRGAVFATLRLISDTPSISVLHASSQSGAVAVRIVSDVKEKNEHSTEHFRWFSNSPLPEQLSRQNQRFYLKAGSHESDITVLVPSDFEGPVTWSNGPRGSTVFSPEVQKRLIPFSRESTRGKAFISDRIPPAMPQAERGWSGDALVLGSHEGRISVSFVGEAQPASSGSGPQSEVWWQMLQDVSDGRAFVDAYNFVRGRLGSGDGASST